MLCWGHSRRSWINLLDVGSSNGGNGGKETELFGRILRRIAYDRHVQAAASGSVALVLQDINPTFTTDFVFKNGKVRLLNPCANAGSWLP
jgi:hypothetical protein